MLLYEGRHIHNLKVFMGSFDAKVSEYPGANKIDLPMSLMLSSN